ncbi:MAG: hypothetical protein QOD74_1689 [Variibacter sp.]|jgi:hypothetical protein|nr:hypothetical protein [Variibacter sp.]
MLCPPCRGPIELPRPDPTSSLTGLALVCFICAIGDGIPAAHHCGGEIKLARAAKRDGTRIAVSLARLTRDLPAGDHSAQRLSGFSPTVPRAARPHTCLTQLRRIDPKEADFDVFDHQAVAIDHTSIPHHCGALPIREPSRCGDCPSEQHADQKESSSPCDRPHAVGPLPRLTTY